MFSIIVLALSALRIQSALAQDGTTLVVTSTSFSDATVDPTPISETDTGAIESISESLVSVSPTTFTTITVTGSGLGVNEPTFPATLTTCWLVSTLPTATATENLDPAASLPPGAQCYEFVREGGGVDEIPLLSVGSDGLTTPNGWATASFPGDVGPSSTSSNLQSNSSSSKKTGKIVGAVLGSIFGFIIIGAILLWLRRHQRGTTQRRFSRTTAWMRNRGTSGWVADEKAPQHFEMQSQQSPAPPRPTHF